MVGKECRATLPDAAVCAAAGRQWEVPQRHVGVEAAAHREDDSRVKRRRCSASA